MDLTQKKQHDQLITDGSESTFMDDVVEASKNQPVIVDFWAPWCGPCKSLGPALEAEINNHSGKVKMVKIDIDQNQSIAQQMRIQSIPAVFAFVDGQPVDGFQGAKTPSEIKDFVKKVISLGPNNNADEGLESALEMAEKMLEDGEFSDSLGVFLAIIDQDAKTTKAYAGVVKSYLGLSELNKAQEFILNLPGDIAGKKRVNLRQSAS
jgi:putative thioredoxin